MHCDIGSHTVHSMKRPFLFPWTLWRMWLNCLSRNFGVCQALEVWNRKLYSGGLYIITMALKVDPITETFPQKVFPIIEGEPDY